MSDLKTAANQVLDAYISMNWVPHAIGKKLHPPMATLMAAVTQESESDSSAELRRLQAEHEEDQGVIAVWRGRTLRAEAQRDALLEALQELCDTLGECGMTERARAAIKAVEGGK